MQQERTSRARPVIQIAVTLCLALVLLALSYVRIIGDAGSAAFGGKIIDAALAGPIWGTALGNRLIVFALTQFFVHVVFVFVCLALAHLSKKAWPSSPHSIMTWLLLWFTFGAGWLLVANAALFPWSSLGRPYYETIAASWYGVSVFSIYSVAMSAALILVVVKYVLGVRRALPRNLTRWGLPAAATVLLLPIALPRLQAMASAAAANEKPHIILIGLDSLRYDAVRTSPQSNTPAIDKFLSEAATFSDATTPLARTFPAWVSIITGRHPHSTGAVINLLPRQMIHPGDTLPSMLSAAGYDTTYAIDEVRFSNLDLSYGFRKMIAPPIGATDFMLGFFADAPLSNLLVNSRIGSALFPYAHANRGAATTYDPDSFVERIDREISFERPTLLAAHFTLAHWPYTWADSDVLPDGAEIDLSVAYGAAIARLDEQFGDFMRMLQKRGALHNAIVILFSDHGESLGSHHGREAPEEGSRQRESGIPEYDERYLAGHGTSVFSAHQYRVVLAVKSYGQTPLTVSAPRTIDAEVSLEDLTPTVRAALELTSAQPFDGRSLLALLEGDPAASIEFENRVRFTETEFNPPSLQPGQVHSTSALLHAATYYKVDPDTDRVVIRGERLDEVLAQRQYAAFHAGKLLAAVPVRVGEQEFEHHALLAIEGAAPVRVANPATYPDQDVARLWEALLARFPHLAGSRQSDSLASNSSDMSKTDR